MSTGAFLALMTHPQKQRLVSIARGVWPNLDERSETEVRGLLNDVDEVLKGGPTPCLSRKEREAVKALDVDEAPRT